MEAHGSWTSDLDYTGVVREHDIRALAHRLVVPTPPPNSEQYQGASLDLTVGAIITPDTVVDMDSDRKEVRLPPGGVATVLTFEELHMPIDLVGTAFAINELSHRGLLVLNPGHVDPGYMGVLSVKLINLQKTHFRIRIGEPIFTVIFERMSKPAKPFEGPHLGIKERIEYIRETVEGTAPAALLDIHGDGLKHLVSVAVYEDLGRHQETTIDLARHYDAAQRELFNAKLDSLHKAVHELQEESVRKAQLRQVIWSELKYWIIGLILLGAALAEILGFVFSLIRGG